MSIISEEEKIYILNLLSTFNLKHLSQYNFMKKLQALDDNFILASGVSKVAIIPKEKNYVIKIPYYGKYRKNNGIKCFDPYFSSISKSGDYCKSEEIIYNKAKANGLDTFFAEIEQIGKIKSIPIYVQRKAVIFEDVYYPEDDEEENLNEREVSIFKTITTKYSDLVEDEYLPISWMKDFIFSYGELAFDKLYNFLSDNNIQDLHSENIGYICERPVLVDFSGFEG